MGTKFLVATALIVVVLAGLYAVLLLDETTVGSAWVETPLTSSPVEVRFDLKGEWTEWQPLPPPGQASCEKGGVANGAEVRIRPTFEGFYVIVSGTGGQKISVDGTVIKIEGIGKMRIRAGFTVDFRSLQIYSCHLVLTK